MRSATPPDDRALALGAYLARYSAGPTNAATKAQAMGQALLAASPHLRSPDFATLAVTDLWHLFEAYDLTFFAGLLSAALGTPPHDRLRLRLSPRMTSVGGKLTNFYAAVPRRFELAISSHLLFTNFAPGAAPVTVNGLPCPTRLDALQRIFEHELVHLAELLVWGRTSCRRRRFFTLAHSLFGHTEVTHRLPTPRQRAWQDHRLRSGDRVWFSCAGRRHEGFVNRITKRATVLVPDPAGQPYSDGGRYAKYYVPVEELQRRG